MTPLNSIGQNYNKQNLSLPLWQFEITIMLGFVPQPNLQLIRVITVISPYYYLIFCLILVFFCMVKLAINFNKKNRFYLLPKNYHYVNIL